MGDPAYEVGRVVGVVAVVVPLIYLAMRSGLQHKSAERELRKRPPLDAHPEPGSDVFVTGTVRLVGEPLLGPLSGRACVAHRSRIYFGATSSASPKYETVALVPFAIERRDGSIITIEAASARFALPALALPQGSGERCEQYAEARGLPKRYRRGATYEEVVVMEGMKVAVGGRVAAGGKLVGDPSKPIIIGVPF